MTETETEMIEHIEEMDKKRSSLSGKLAVLQNKISTLNKEASKHARKRDAITSDVRELVDKANKCKEARDVLNVQVRETKAVRDELNAKARKGRETVDSMKKQRLPNDGVTIGRLKRELKRLEFEQQTKVLTTPKEKALVEAMARVEKQIKERENIIENDGEIKKLLSDVRESEKEADEAHKKIEALVAEAQKQHDDMIALFAEVDKLRKDADEEHAKFVEIKTEANKFEEESRVVYQEFRDCEKVLYDHRRKERDDEREKAKNEVERKADDLFKRFMAGEKLSTDDLMVLQKAGLL